MEKWLFEFANWLAATEWSISLHESFYMWNWMESTHVLFLMTSLGLLVVIDLRMLGLWMSDVPASKIAARLVTPMLISFVIMAISGAILFTSIPVRYTHSLWFRLKLLLLLVAAINAILLHRNMNKSVATWDMDKVAPKRIRFGAALSLALWVAIVICGRFIANNWFDCDRDNNAFVTWATGCAIEVSAAQ